MHHLYIPHLLACALHDTVPMDKPPELSWEGLYEECHRHSVSATVYHALAKLNPPPSNLDKWREAYQMSMVKELTFNAARGEIFDVLDREGIDYMPLKGVILKDYYPKVGMRMFCDNDILVDEHKAKQVEQVMRGLGYEGRNVPVSNQDVYKKQPVLNIEIHKWMVQKKSPQYSYWEDVWNRAIPVSGHGYRQRDEDYFLFFLSHFYRHFSTGGCGIRSLADNYQILHHLGDKMDWDYINGELEKLKLTQFNQKMRQLTMMLFQDPNQLPQLDEEMGELYCEVMESGTYGTHTKNVSRSFQASGRSRVGYVLSRILPSYAYGCTFFPILSQYPVLYVVGFLPLCIFRFYRAISGMSRTKSEIYTIFHTKAKK